MSSEYQSGDLTAIIERFLLLKKEGLTMPIEQLCKDSPHLADDVARELNALDNMDRLLDTRESSTIPKPAPKKFGGRLGDSKNKAPNSSNQNPSYETSSSYQIEKLLAHGGCSEVYVAHDERLNRQVAIKFLRPDTEHLDVYKVRLQREAEITSRLDHPGVVSIHSVGSDNRGMPFYTMRFVEGQSLAAAIEDFHKSHSSERHVFYSPVARRLLKHFCDVCQTIAFAHSKRVLHRDVKPANIVIGQFAETYVVDWGLARSLDAPVDTSPDAGQGSDTNSNKTSVTLSGDLSADSSRLTRLGNAMGSPAYMSPEQAAGRSDVGTASDIFNLGATLYTILAGKPPYENSSLVRTLKDAETASFSSPRSCNADVPVPLDAICRKAMSLNPLDRYSTAEQMVSDVECFLSDEPVSVIRDTVSDRLRRWVKRRRTLVFALATSALVAFVLLVTGNAMLLENNRKLAQRESEAIFLRGETRTALNDANRNLYSQRIALANAEYQKNNPHRAIEILNECPLELRQWEWHHLHWLITRHEPFRQIKGDGQAIHGVAIRRDSRVAAFAGTGGAILIWDFQNNKVLHRWQDNIEVAALTFSPDGKHLAVAGKEMGSRSRSAIRLWDIETGLCIAERHSKSGGFNSVEYSSDGTLIATGAENGGIRIRDSGSLVPVLRVNDLKMAVGCVSFIDDTHRFVSCGGDGKIRTWDSQGNLVSEQSGHQGAVTNQAQNESVYVTCGSDKLVKVWRRIVDAAKSVNDQSVQWIDRDARILVGHTDKIQTVCLSTDGKLVASAGLDRIIRLWNTATGEELAVLRQHSSHVRCLRFDPNGKFLFSCGDDNRVNVWQLDSLVSPIPTGHAIAFGNGARNLVSVAGESIEIWDAVDRLPVARSTDHPSKITTVVSSLSRSLVASLYVGGDVIIWNSENGRRLHRLQGNSSPAYSAAFSEDGRRLFVGHHDGEINVWNTKSGLEEFSRSATNILYRMSISNDGKKLLTGHRDGSLAIWSTTDLSLINTIQTGSETLLDIAVHPTLNEVASTGRNGEICIWDFDTGKQKLRMEVGESWLNCMCYSPDGNRLVSGSEHTITFWNPADGSEVVSFSAEKCIHSMAFSLDGRYFAVAGEDPRVRILEAPSFR